LLIAHPDKPLLYSSEQILERRRRLLRETRQMLAEDGLDGFSVRKLCKRAEVAPRTFYNAFSSKDRLIALAIRDAYDEFQRFISFKTDPATVAGIVDRTLSTNRRNFKIRHYTQAVTSIYFASSTPEDICRAIQDMAVAGWRDWLRMLKSRGEMKAWVNIDLFCNQLANLQYSIINDWCLGRTPDDDYLAAMLEGTLTHAMGAITGAPYHEAEEILVAFNDTGQLPSYPAAIWSPSRTREA
jgi:AcrR family transcriptional regulator